MSVDSKTYCPVLFDTIYSSNSNDSYNLCCFASENNELDKKYKQKTHTPFEFFLSKEMNEIRNKSLKEEKISQCTRCYNEESATGYSNRKRYIDERKGKLPYKVKNIKFSKDVLHQSKLINDFNGDYAKSKIEKDLNSFLKKIKKDKKYLISIKIL